MRNGKILVLTAAAVVLGVSACKGKYDEAKDTTGTTVMSDTTAVTAPAPAVTESTAVTTGTDTAAKTDTTKKKKKY